MKVAITADLHLTTRAENPERFHALEQILDQMKRLDVQHLIMAGDVFDASRDNYGELESLCTNPRYLMIRFHIIPGNHDYRLGRGSIVADNVTIYDRPELTRLAEDDFPFLFLPYEPAKTMGERLAELQGELSPDRWILIGHGDWSGQLRNINLFEPGVYMPLTKRDIKLFRPAFAFLGHIHAPSDRAPIHYPGSPCPIDITETGHRRFLIYDSARRSVTPMKVSTDVLYFSEVFTVLPIDDDLAHLRTAVRTRIEAWGLTDDEVNKVRVRIKARGYCTDRVALRETLSASLEPFQFYDEQPIDIAEVSTAGDPGRAYLADRVRERIADIDMSGFQYRPDRDEVILAALRLVYGDK